MENMNLLSLIRKLRLIRILNLLSLFLLFLCSSCDVDDLLTEKPKAVAVENYYNTADEIEAAVNSIYSHYRTNSHAIYLGTLDIQTDWGYGRGSYAQFNDFQALNATNINRVKGFWVTFYRAIRNANLVIENAPNAPGTSQEESDRFVAEAKFLRAFSYFHLVRNWGEVPLRTEENMLVQDLERSSVDEIYSLIIADLREAEVNLPGSPTHIGRPTLWAAKTMLADVYLTLEMYGEARDKANEVINSNQYSLVPIETREDFNNLFGPEVVTTSEEIFYFKFARQPGQGNYLPWILNHPSTRLYNFGGAYANYGEASIPFYQNWNDGDLRKDLWDIVDFGLGSTTMVSGKFADPAAVSGHNAGNDQPIYRYAEVLLIYAEAATRAAETPTEEAVEALNKVHRRAYGYNPLIPSPVDYNINNYNAENFVDLVIRERAYEFIFEGKRWFDLKRTGKAEEAIMENRGLRIADSRYLWPIPIEELNANDAIGPEDQNPGY